MDINCPHDNTFKSLMKDKRVARDFFKHNLPKNILPLIDLNKLEICPCSYVDDLLNSTASDILYKTEISGRKAYIYLLCEHQSYIDRWLPFRIWQYIIRIWADDIKQKTKKRKKGNNKNIENEPLLPLVIPMVFYHGKHPYTASTDILDLIDAPKELIDEFLFKPFHLIDMHKIEDETLREQHWAGVMSFVMKHIFERDFMPYVDTFLNMTFKMLLREKASAFNFYDTLLFYVLETGEIRQPDEFNKKIKTQTDKLKDNGVKSMKMADWLKEQGRLEGVVSFALNLLESKFGEIPNNYRQQIKKANVSTLQSLCQRMLQAKTLNELFETEQAAH